MTDIAWSAFVNRACGEIRTIAYTVRTCAKSAKLECVDIASADFMTIGASVNERKNQIHL